MHEAPPTARPQARPFSHGARVAGHFAPGWLGWLLIGETAALTWRLYAVHKQCCQTKMEAAPVRLGSQRAASTPQDDGLSFLGTPLSPDI